MNKREAMSTARTMRDNLNEPVIVHEMERGHWDCQTRSGNPAYFEQLRLAGNDVVSPALEVGFNVRVLAGVHRDRVGQITKIEGRGASRWVVVELRFEGGTVPFRDHNLVVIEPKKD